MLVYDHVLGAVHEGRDPELWGPYTEDDPFHEPFVAAGLHRRDHDAHRARHGSPDPPAAADGARREAGCRDRPPLGRQAAPGCRARLELCRVRIAERGLLDQGQALLGAGRPAPSSLDRAAARLPRRVAPDRPGLDPPAARPTDPDLVRRLQGAGAATRCPHRRRLHLLREAGTTDRRGGTTPRPPCGRRQGIRAVRIRGVRRVRARPGALARRHRRIRTGGLHARRDAFDQRRAARPSGPYRRARRVRRRSRRAS